MKTQVLNFFIIVLGHCLCHVEGYYEVVSMDCELSHDKNQEVSRCPSNDANRSLGRKFCCGTLKERTCCDLEEKLAEEPDFNPSGRKDITMRIAIPYWQIIILTTSFLVLVGLCFYVIGWGILEALYIIFCCPCCCKKKQSQYYDVTFAEKSSLVRNPNFFRAPPRPTVLSPSPKCKEVSGVPTQIIPQNPDYKAPPPYNEV
eukprot:TRINITY_DN3028_c0_g1_i1.p1 TRINITY_DN3028_c0_g1~~TRINITY_DN3028_c0_g1_i1.p1  ORF type:complete len:214 (-),score=18.96 TRINITY_DN3028_c0_g1_i1:127-732(-)